jgi:hypothetical protein
MSLLSKIDMLIEETPENSSILQDLKDIRMQVVLFQSEAVHCHPDLVSKFEQMIIDLLDTLRKKIKK